MYKNEIKKNYEEYKNKDNFSKIMEKVDFDNIKIKSNNKKIKIIKIISLVLVIIIILVLIFIFIK